MVYRPVAVSISLIKLLLQNKKPEVYLTVKKAFLSFVQDDAMLEA